jgi:hypothetical protein
MVVCNLFGYESFEEYVSHAVIQDTDAEVDGRDLRNLWVAE